MIGRIIKWIFGAALSVMTALVIVTAGLVYLLGLNEAKVTQLTRFFATMRFIETEYVDDVEPSKLGESAAEWKAGHPSGEAAAEPEENEEAETGNHG